jgi:hypothetical protein
MTNRNKSRAVTVYLDPKYNDTISYLKLTQGLTNYIEQCLDAVKVDPEKLKAVQTLKM